MGENGTRIVSNPHGCIRLKSESGSEEVHYSLLYEGIPDEYRQVALKMLNETEENKRNGLKKLKDFMKKEDLTCSEQDLMLVLRNCKYDLRKSEKKLKRFLNFRQHILERLTGMDDSKTDAILDHIVFGVLPYRDKHGRVIFFSRPNTLNFNFYSAEELLTIALVHLLWLSSSSLTSVTGAAYIAECKTDDLYSLYTVMKVYLRNVKHMLTLNGNGFESLWKSYHPDILPEDFGGNLDPINNTYYKEQFLEFLQKLKTESQNLTGKS